MKFPIPAFIFLGLFVVASVIQLVLAFLEKESMRRKEKFTCLLFLTLFAVFAAPDKPLIYIGAFLAMLGDILDLNLRTFYFGVLAFFSAHICYILEIILDILGGVFPWYMGIALVGTFILVMVLMYNYCKKKPTHGTIDKIGQSVYFATLFAYLPVIIYSMVVVGKYMYLSLIGALFFIASDSILVRAHFGPKFKRYHFHDMITYLIAEVLLVLGFILTLVI